MGSSFFKKETERYEEGRNNVIKSRTEWNQKKFKILENIKSIIIQVEHENHPLKLKCFINDKIENFESIQIDFGPIFTGIDIRSDSGIIESGIESESSIVISQLPCGELIVIMNPFKSNYHRRVEKNIIIHHSFKVNNVDLRFLRNIISKGLRYARLSSIYSAHKMSISDRWFLFGLKFSDVRSRIYLKKTIISLDNEWAKLIITSIVSAFVATFVTLVMKIS
ncbi:hypothetical protein M3918_003347 [Vibrio metschnikovii]|uniref:hypothetical protein n=1 Tax=Vibrio metschnikovii TaxID=28172 RepID=UPI0029FBAE7C|nr:hypothetical protein [Vibrio metschnikovii]EKO3632997.1 hypothetical protein [Vibrio metschnikovii]EKO3646684.1 hypothetical protein [Vibrio metschnikovii]EKO3650134.1 hypothetical protein [Vibrio metschnikovii]